MSKQTKYYVAWTIGYILFFLPSNLYFLINGYWWLFDGNHPIEAKMTAAGIISLFGGVYAIFLAMIQDVVGDRVMTTNKPNKGE